MEVKNIKKIKNIKKNKNKKEATKIKEFLQDKVTVKKEINKEEYFLEEYFLEERTKRRESFLNVISYFTKELFSIFLKIDDFFKENCQEIRFRAGLPVTLHIKNNKICFIDSKSVISEKLNINTKIVSQAEVGEIFKKACDYCIYDHQEEISQGFVTLKNGHRIGLSGDISMIDGKVSGFSQVLSLNIRIAKEYKNSSLNILRAIKTTNKSMGGILIIGEPGSGKTTLLRDMARCLSLGTVFEQKEVAIIDERNEISGSFLNGKWAYDIGICDVLLNVPKTEGIIMAIRSLSPQVLICDEISSTNDTYNVKQTVNSGVSLITSIHAESFEELLKKDSVRSLLETGAFSNIVILEGRKNPCLVKEILPVNKKIK